MSTGEAARVSAEDILWDPDLGSIIHNKMISREDLINHTAVISVKYLNLQVLRLE